MYNCSDFVLVIVWVIHELYILTSPGMKKHCHSPGHNLLGETQTSTSALPSVCQIDILFNRESSGVSSFSFHAIVYLQLSSDIVQMSIKNRWPSLSNRPIMHYNWIMHDGGVKWCKLIGAYASSPIHISVLVLSDINECSSSPCGIGGTCSEEEVNEYTCTCLPGYTGTRCETGKTHFIISIF